MSHPPTVALEPEQMLQLEQLATRTGRPVEDLIRVAVDDLLRRSDPGIVKLAERIADKNAELYRRLAQ
ncbi:MAG: ribbon-helix-helix protein, CopG family [Planctomycetota bacterium]